MTMKPLITPTVNLNGTAGSELIKQRLRVIKGIDDLIDTLRAYTPHGRDYQTELQSVLYEAQGAWADRISLLLGMRDDFHADAIAIDKQTSNRRRA